MRVLRRAVVTANHGFDLDEAVDKLLVPPLDFEQRALVIVHS